MPGKRASSELAYTAPRLFPLLRAYELGASSIRASATSSISDVGPEAASSSPALLLACESTYSALSSSSRSAVRVPADTSPSSSPTGGSSKPSDRCMRTPIRACRRRDPAERARPRLVRAPATGVEVVPKGGCYYADRLVLCPPVGVGAAAPSTEALVAEPARRARGSSRQGSPSARFIVRGGRGRLELHGIVRRVLVKVGRMHGTP